MRKEEESFIKSQIKLFIRYAGIDFVKGCLDEIKEVDNLKESKE